MILNIIISGNNFIPSHIKGLDIETIINSGDISKIGRYRGKPSPYGIGVISFEYCPKKVLDCLDILKDVEFDDINFQLNLRCDEDLNLSNDILKCISDIGGEISVNNIK